MRSVGVTPSPCILRLFVAGVLPEHWQVGFVVDVLRQFLSRCELRDIYQLQGFFLQVVQHPEAASDVVLWLLFELEQHAVLERRDLKTLVERKSILQLLLKCSRCGDCSTAERLLALMERHMMSKTVDVLALMLWTYAVGEEVEKAFETLEEMQRRGLLDHTDSSRKFVVEALGLPMEKHYLMTLAESLYNVEAVDRAYYHLERRHSQQRSVSVHSLDVVVLACGKLGDEDRAVETMESYSNFGIEPRTQSYNALLLSCSGRHRAHQHSTVFEAMVRNGIKPNHHTFRSLIRQAVLSDNIDEALGLLDRVTTFPHVHVEVEMVLPILERAARVGDLDTVLQLLRLAVSHSIGIEVGTMRMVVRRLRDHGVDVKAVEELIPVHERLRGRAVTDA